MRHARRSAALRAASNFWFDAEIDQRRGRLEGGPAGEDGGFRLNVTMRNQGRITQPIVIQGEALGNNLTLRIWDHEGKLIYARATIR